MSSRASLRPKMSASIWTTRPVSCDGLSEAECKSFIDEHFDEKGLTRGDCSDLSPSDHQGYHHSWNAKSYFKVGKKMGEAVVRILGPT